MTNSQTLAAAAKVVGFSWPHYDMGRLEVRMLDWLAERDCVSLALLGDKSKRKWWVFVNSLHISESHKRRELALAKAVLAVSKQEQSK